MPSRSRAVPIIIAASGAAAFIVVANAVANGSARLIDEALRKRLLKLRSGSADAASTVITGLTAPAMLIAASLALAVAARRRGTRVWLPIAASPFVAMAVGRTFTAVGPQQYAPASVWKDGENEQCFPSGHTTGATAEALTAAYVLRRERLIDVPTAAIIALLPAIGGVNRLYRDRHWASDIVAGWAVGTAIAAILAALSDA